MPKEAEKSLRHPQEADKPAPEDQTNNVIQTREEGSIPNPQEEARTTIPETATEFIAPVQPDEQSIPETIPPHRRMTILERKNGQERVMLHDKEGTVVKTNRALVFIALEQTSIENQFSGDELKKIICPGVKKIQASTRLYATITQCNNLAKGARIKIENGAPGEGKNKGGATYYLDIIPENEPAVSTQKDIVNPQSTEKDQPIK